MKVIYDPEVDVRRILFRDVAVEESDEDKPGVILDCDMDGNILGMEVLNASQRVENPRGVEYAITLWQDVAFRSHFSSSCGQYVTCFQELPGNEGDDEPMYPPLRAGQVERW